MKTNKVAKAQKAQGKCARCGTEIKAGSAYYWIKFAYGPRKTFCIQHTPKPSEKTVSDKLSRLYSAREAVQDLAGGEFEQQELADALNEAASEAREVGEEYRNSKENLPEGLQDSQTGQGLEEKADQCDQWADELESAASEIEGLEWPEETEEETAGKSETSKEETEEAETDEQTEEEADEEETLEERLDAIRQEANDIAGAALDSLEL